MKLISVSYRVQKRDYHDLYEIFIRIPVEKLFKAALKKYGILDLYHVAKALGYLRDVECQPDPPKAKRVWE